jgi:hypothetical protein
MRWAQFVAAVRKCCAGYKRGSAKVRLKRVV